MGNIPEAEFERTLKKELRRGIRGETDKLGENQWAQPGELGPEWSYASGSAGLLLGRREGRLIGWNDDRHLLTVAGTRAGKGVSLIIPNLLLYPGSVLAIDPKGELAREAGPRRKQIGKLVVLDPFNENGEIPTGSYNPLDELDPTSKDVIDEAGAIAQALVIYSGQGDPHWTSAARGLLRALILLALDTYPGAANLVHVRELLMLTDPALVAAAANKKVSPAAELFAMMISLGDRYERVVCGQGQAFKDMAEKERESVLSEARTQTQFLDSPRLKETLRKSDFRLKELATSTLSVFLCLPARHMDTHDRWMRVIINLAIGALEPRRTDSVRTRAPVLLLLEEFPVLKHMEKLEAAAGQLAGSGVKLWVIVQNLGQIKRHYKDAWETFVANAGVVTAFGNADLETLQYLRGKLGNVPMLLNRSSGASSSALLSGARPLQEDLRDAALLEVNELERGFERGKERLLVMAAGHAPLILQRMFYYQDKMFEGMFRARG